MRYNSADVGQVSAVVDGLQLKSIAASEFKRSLQTILSDDVLDWLTSRNDQAITPDEFKAQGILLSLQPQDLTIEISLSEAAMATDSLSYGREKHFEAPKGEAKWAVLNNLNLNHERSNNIHDHSSRLEWLMNANVGGGDGINMQSSVFWERSEDKGSRAYRGDIQLFYDQPDEPFRVTLGDTRIRSVGHLSGLQLGGIGLEKAYAELQPQRRVTPGNSQQFVLPRSATLEVFINEFLLSRIKLKAGRYDLSDLPLTSGVNDIRVIATYANGETEEFNFTSHYNSRLLAKGLDDYSVALGRASSLDAGQYQYGDDVLLSGYYDYGISDNLTLGFNGVLQSHAHVIGSVAAINSPVGNISLRYSISEADDITGQAYSIETEHTVLGHGNYGSPNLRLGFEQKQNFVSAPWQALTSIDSSKRAFMDYSYLINDHIDFNLNASRSENSESLVSKNVKAELNIRYESFRIRLGYNYSASDDSRVLSENQYVLNFSWNLYNRKNYTRMQAQYNNRSKVASASYTKTNNNFLDDYGYELRTENGQDHRQEQLKASYTGAFFRADISTNNYTRSKRQADSSASINLSTSVGIADGYLGVGATTTAPFAVVTKHKTLKGTDVLVNVDRLGRVKTQSWDNVGALIDLGSGYATSQFNIDVPDAPLGYDWGPGMYKLVGGASTGHHIQVGSDLSYTVIGTLLDEQGTPIAMQRGQVTKRQNIDSSLETHLTRPFFTNRTGRFVVEGLSVGDYLIEVEGNIGTFSVQEAEQKFVKVGEIKLDQAQLQGDSN
ncbi:fimbria/pilus outer membrane usher protein (plasmid) [Pseudoalteromonas sp. T1lg65]|uniref:fimbria/pilus outer membrane usher protein n=1 Tax=Pseudoalteromonas sp. T1lg65 TaxID=2077101 RepID=UPI003F7A1A61